VRRFATASLRHGAGEDRFEAPRIALGLDQEQEPTGRATGGGRGLVKQHGCFCRAVLKFPS
jgi:hypothetical protein